MCLCTYFWPFFLSSHHPFYFSVDASNNPLRSHFYHLYCVLRTSDAKGETHVSVSEREQGCILNWNVVWFRIILHLLLILVSFLPLSLLLLWTWKSFSFWLFPCQRSLNLFLSRFSNVMSWICWTETVLRLVFGQQFLWHFTSFYSSRLYFCFLLFFLLLNPWKWSKYFQTKMTIVNECWFVLYVIKQPIMESAWAITS